MASWGFKPLDLVEYQVHTRSHTPKPVEQFNHEVHPIFQRRQWLDCHACEWLFVNIHKSVDTRLRRSTKLSAQIKTRLLTELQAIQYVEDGSDPDASRKRLDSWLEVNKSHLQARDYSYTNMTLSRGILPGKPFDPDTYNSLLPILQLATKLLELCTPFLWQLRYAKCEVVDNVLVYKRHRSCANCKASKVCETSDTENTEGKQPSHKALELFCKHLEQGTPERIVLFLHDRLYKTSKGSAEADGRGGGALAKTGLLDNWKDRKRPSRIRIGIDKDYAGLFIHSKPGSSSKSTYQFQLARTLVHEVAHAVAKLNNQSIEWGGPKQQSEPWYDHTDMRNGQSPELGLALETYLFGGLSRLIGRDQLVKDRAVAWLPRLTIADEVNNIREHDASWWGVQEKCFEHFCIDAAWERSEEKKKKKKKKKDRKHPLYLTLSPCRAHFSQLEMEESEEAEFDQWLSHYYGERTLASRCYGKRIDC